MRRAHLIPLLALSALVVSSVVTPLAAQSRRGPVVRLPAYRTPIALDTMPYTNIEIGAPSAETYAALRQTYTDLKLKVDYADSANGHLGSMNIKMSRRLGGERMSKFFNCGRGITGENADDWRLTIAAVTFVTPPKGDTAAIGTALAAQAEDMAGASKLPAMCQSTGVLEIRIGQMVRERLARAAKP